MKVLIVTHGNDNDCIDTVTRALEERGASAFRLDTDLFPTEVRISASSRADDATEAVTITTPAGTLDLDEVTAIWYRRVGLGAGIPESMESQLRKASIEETRRSFFGVLAQVRTFVLDPPARIRAAEAKALQLRLARELGLETPRTLMSNDPSAVRAFADSCPDGIVTKMLSSFAIYEDGEENVVFTNRMSQDDLEHLDGLRYCPMTFQELIPKKVELRTTIVGDQVFTAAVDSQALERAQLDWRREGVALLEKWRPYELPAQVSERLLAMMDAYGLNYGAVDFIVTPDERHVFLEINPAGEFFWLERSPGFPLSAALADVLLDRVPRRTRAPLETA